MTGRRGNGEGSIYQRKDGRWVAAYWAEADGKKQRKYVYGKTRQQTAEQLRAAQNQVAQGMTPPPARVTVAQYLTDWLDNVAGSSVKPSTLDGYRWVLNRYWFATIGHRRLAELQPGHVQAVLRAMEERGLSPRTIRQARTILRRALAQAERWGQVSRNVAALTEAPRIGRSVTNDALSAPEARAYLAAAENVQWGAACAVALLTGLRKGEVLALCWSNVVLDTEDPHVVVKGTLKRRTGHGLVIDMPKSEASVRSVGLAPPAVVALKEQKAAQNRLRLSQGDQWPDGDFVFTTDRGTLLDPANVRRRHLVICEGAGLGQVRFHALRHTWATLALEAGVPLEVVSRTLGHASLSITADIYAKVGERAKRSAVDAVAGLIESA